MNIKGIVLAKRDNQYDIRLENTTQNIITYVENTTGLELNIGDIVIVTYTDYNDPPVITNVYNKTISVDSASEILTKLKTVDGIDSGLDADLLDGHNSDYFIKTSDADNIQVETYTNGIRIKKDGTYVYSACWGSVNVPATTSTGVNTYRGTTTVTFPFEFTTPPIITVGAYSSTPLMANCGNGAITTTTGILTAERTTTGSQTCRYIVEGR